MRRQTQPINSSDTRKLYTYYLLEEFIGGRLDRSASREVQVGRIHRGEVGLRVIELRLVVDDATVILPHSVIRGTVGRVRQV